MMGVMTAVAVTVQLAAQDVQLYVTDLEEVCSSVTAVCVELLLFLFERCGKHCSSS